MSGDKLTPYTVGELRPEVCHGFLMHVHRIASDDSTNSVFEHCDDTGRLLAVSGRDEIAGKLRKGNCGGCERYLGREK